MPAREEEGTDPIWHPPRRRPLRPPWTIPGPHKPTLTLPAQPGDTAPQMQSSCEPDAPSLPKTGSRPAGIPGCQHTSHVPGQLLCLVF